MEKWLKILAEATNSPFGKALLCVSPEAADKSKRQLYVARAKAREQGNLDYDGLSLSISPHSDSILYIHHKGEEDEEESLEVNNDTET